MEITQGVLDRAQGCLLGQLAGDSLGALVEFEGPKEISDAYPDGVAGETDVFHGVHIDGPDYAELVAPFGGYGQRVEDPARLTAALRAGLYAVNDGKVAILNVVLDH